VSLARSLDAELVIIAIVATETFATPVAMGSPGLASLRSDIERHVQEELHKVAAGIPADVTASTKRLTGDAEQLLTEQTEESTSSSWARGATARRAPCSRAGSAVGWCARRTAR
jgi:hypothetical protein